MPTIGIDCRMYSSSFTGIGRYTYELIHNLAKIDQQNQYFLFFNSPEFETFHTPGPNFTPILVNAKHYSLAEQIKFLAILNSYKLDVMHFTHFNAPILYHHPTIVTIHDLTLHFFPGKKMSSIIYRIAYRLTIKSIVKKSKKIIAVSHNTASDLESILSVKASKIKVIYEGVNENFYPIDNLAELTPTLKKYQIDQDFLLYTGVWRNHKNLQGLIDGFFIIQNNFPNIKLIITGKTDNIYASEIFKQVEKLNLKEKIIFTGLVSELELVHLINAAAVYVFPSFYEGFGLPALEAMQCGTPVAVSNTSSLPEICQDNVMYFNPYQPKELAKAVEKLLTNTELYQKLSLAGLNYVKMFSWSKMATETHKLYLDISKS